MNRLFRLGLWGRLVEDLKLLCGLTKAYWKGEYRAVSVLSFIVFGFAIAYVLIPIDIISDFVPVVGQVDDSIVVIVCLFLLERDLHKYKKWKMSYSERGDKNGR